MSDFKAKMYKIRFPLGLRPRPRSRCLQLSPRSPSYLRDLLLRGGRGRGRGGKGEKKGREEEGEGVKGRGQLLPPTPPPKIA